LVKTKVIKIPLEEWRGAKIAAVSENRQLMEWIAEAIREKLEREKGGKQ